MYSSKNLPITGGLIDSEISVLCDIRMHEDPGHRDFCLLSCSWEVVHAYISESVANSPPEVWSVVYCELPTRMLYSRACGHSCNSLNESWAVVVVLLFVA